MTLHRPLAFDEAYLAKRAPQKLKLLNFIREETRAGRPFPSCIAMAKHMGWKSAQSARDACSILVYQYGALTGYANTKGTYNDFQLTEAAR